MKTKKLLLLSILLVSFFACNQKSAKDNSNSEEAVKHEDTSAFFTIDFAEIIKNKRDVPISEIAESVEYIPLENNSQSMIGNIMDVQLTKDYIFIKHNGSPLLTQFDRTGKFIRHIGTEGRGPKEYGLMRIFSLDRKNQLIYIHTNWTRKILVYNFEGEYVKTLKYDAISRLQNTWSRDSFMVSFSPPSSGMEPYSFIEVNFSGDTTQTIENQISWDKKGDRSFMVSYWGRDEFYWTDNKLHMKGWYNDTVYTYNEQNKIIPKYFIDLKEYKIPEDLIPEKMTEKPLPRECYWVGLNESGKYIFVRYGSHADRNNDNPQMGCVVYNKKTKDGFALKNKAEKYGFINDLNGGPDFKPRYSNDSLAFVDISALDMKLYLDSEEFKNSEVKFPEQKEKLAELNKTLKEDDNSFLMIAKLKE